MAEGKKFDVDGYVPTRKMNGPKNFKELCKDPTYPCRLCDRTKRPMDCTRLKECAKYQKWFSREWRRIRRALTIEKPNKMY